MLVMRSDGSAPLRVARGRSLVLLAQLATFLVPILYGKREFVNWDDQIIFEQTHGWKGMGLNNVRWALSSQRRAALRGIPSPLSPHANARGSPLSPLAIATA